MVLLITSAFLLLTQVFLWLIIGLVVWFVLTKALPRPFLSLLVLLLILVVLGSTFWNGPPTDGVLDALWRIISFPLSPLGMALLLLLILYSPKIKLSKFWERVVIAGLVVLTLTSLPVVAYSLVQELEMAGIEQIRNPPTLPAGSRRVIVLLGQGTTYPQLRSPRDTVPSPPPKTERPIRPEAFQTLIQLPTQLTEKGDRILYAAKLYQDEVRAGTNPLLVVSAPTRPDRKRKDRDTREDISEANDIKTMLTQTLNVPAGAILLETQGSSIHDSAERIQKLLSNPPNNNFGNQLILVSSAMNMSRVTLAFNQVFNDGNANQVTMVARPTDFRTLPPPSSLVRQVSGRDLVEREIQISDLLPRADAFCLTSEAVEEYLSSFYYFLRGWIKPFQAPP
jgi:hypothetical protein